MTDDDRSALDAFGLADGIFAAAFSASPTPMVVTDARRPDNPIVWMNAAFLALTGYAREELLGRNCRMLQGPDSNPDEIRRMREAVAAARPIECELFNYRKDGTPFWNAMTIAPVRDGSGAVAYFYAAQADMTDKRRFEMYALAASIVGKCHFCVSSHYALLKNEQGMSAQQLRDVGRIAAVVSAAANVLAIEGK